LVKRLSQIIILSWLQYHFEFKKAEEEEEEEVEEEEEETKTRNGRKGNTYYKKRKHAELKLELVPSYVCVYCLCFYATRLRLL
jgi:hypothetical protein